MQQWTKILPFFVVEWIAKKYLEKFYDDRVKANLFILTPMLDCILRRLRSEHFHLSLPENDC